MKVLVLVINILISSFPAIPNIAFSGISPEQRKTMIDKCVEEMGKTREECADYIDQESDREEISEGFDAAGEYEEYTTVNATTTIILALNMFATIIHSVQKDSKIRPSGLASLIIGCLVGIAWIIFSIIMFSKMKEHKKYVQETYGGSLTITKTYDEEYAELQTKIIDEYIADLENQREMHETRYNGAIAGAIGYLIPLLLAAVELVLCVVPYTKVEADAAQWCKDPLFGGASIESSQSKKDWVTFIFAHIIDHSYACDEETGEGCENNILSGLKEFTGVLGAAVMATLMPIVFAKKKLTGEVYTRVVAYGVDLATMFVQKSYQKEIMDLLDTRIDALEDLKDQILQEVDDPNAPTSPTAPAGTKTEFNSSTLGGEQDQIDFYQENCVDYSGGKFSADSGCKTKQKVTFGLGIGTGSPFKGLMETEGIVTDPSKIAEAAEKLLNEKVSAQDAFKDLGVTNKALADRLFKNLLKKAKEHKPDLFEEYGGDYDKAVDEELFKQVKQARDIVHNLTPEQKSSLSSLFNFGEEKKNYQESDFLKKLKEKKKTISESELNKFKPIILNDIDSDITEVNPLESSGEILEKFNFSEKDINTKKDVPIWEIIRRRYLLSGYRRLLKKK